MARKRAERVLVIGLDCAAPRFVFGPERFDLPHLQVLASAGGWGRLASCDPPITVPAWTSMMSGKDPGVLGCYGFRNRTGYSYGAMATATAADVREKRVWDILSRHGKKVVVLGVPQTYPATPVNGWLVADFLAPELNVIDANRILVRHGPGGGNLKDVVAKNTVIASGDPALADTFACGLADVDPMEVSYLEVARQRGFGRTILDGARIVRTKA